MRTEDARPLVLERAGVLVERSPVPVKVADGDVSGAREGLCGRRSTRARLLRPVAAAWGGGIPSPQSPPESIFVFHDWILCTEQKLSGSKK
jgi:hypothetical protein